MNIFPDIKRVAAILVAAFVALASTASAGTSDTPSAPTTAESPLIATLGDPNATDNAKVTAAQQLGSAGTDAAIASLLLLLESDKPFLRDAAREGLENNPSAKTEPALLAAAAKLTGPARIGVIQSLGNCGTDKSIPALKEFASSDDPAISAAATASLGKIATPAALAALDSCLGKCPAAAIAYLRAADRIAAKNSTAEAAQCYRRLNSVTQNIPAAVKQGALRGAIIGGGKDGLALWEKTILNEKDAAGVDTALRVVTEYPAGRGATATFARPLGKLPADAQVNLIKVLAARSDKTITGVIENLVVQNGSSEELRLAAAQALFVLGNADVAEKTFNLLLASNDASIATGAQNALRGMSYETPAAEAAAGFKSMFNRKNLDDWRGGDGWWTVTNEVLTAESTGEKPCQQNSHLFWKGGEKGSFELRAEFRLSRDANSGIQFRAEDKNADTSYQADMNGGGDYIGVLYHPSFHLIGERGASVTLHASGEKTTALFSNKEALAKYAFKTGTWNEYRIIAKDRTITLYVNGVKTSEFTDERTNAPTKGFITLQMHAGPPMKIEFRNLRIRDL